MYDGACKLCKSQADNLAKLAKGKVRSEALQTALRHFPEISEAEALKEIKMVGETGQVYGGAEAIVQLINRGQPILGKLLYPYYIPGLRQLSDSLYAWVAKNRYKLFGKVPEDACEDGACSVHFNLPDK
jgi:predicted DCC family thiol-disulfide oxidoreductase YuxK